MYGDTEVIRGLARTLREQGEELRGDAAALQARAAATPWEGLAAGAMRLRVRDEVAGLRAAAELVDEAAAALDRHADEVDRLKALIAAIEERVLGWLGSLAGVFHDFVPPPSGHRDWLTVDLPGLP